MIKSSLSLFLFILSASVFGAEASTVFSCSMDDGKILQVILEADYYKYSFGTKKKIYLEFSNHKDDVEIEIGTDGYTGERLNMVGMNNKGSYYSISASVKSSKQKLGYVSVHNGRGYTTFLCNPKTIINNINQVGL